MSAMIKENTAIGIKKLFIIMLLYGLLSQTFGCAHHVLQSSSPTELTFENQALYSIPMVYYLPKGKIHVQYKMAAGTQAPAVTTPAKTSGRGSGSPTITNIAPRSIKADQDTTITISGKKFPMGKSTDTTVEVYDSSGNQIPQAQKSPSVANSTTMTYVVHLQAGSYYFIVSTLAGATNKSPLLTVTSDGATPSAPTPPSGGATGTTPNITIETVYEPDPAQCYVLYQRPNIGYDDTVTVSLTDNSLLGSVQISSTSQITPIIMRMVDIAKAAIEISIPLPGARGMAPIPPFDVIIDPDDILQNSNLTSDKPDNIAKKLQLPELPAGSLLKLERLGPESPLLKNQPVLNKPEESRTIFYRPLWPYKFTFNVPDLFNITKTVYLPNKEPVIAIDIARPAFTKAVTNLTFKSGILTEVHLERPSELLAGLEIPLDILKAIAGIPAEMLQFKVNYGTDYIKYLQQQIQEIQLKQQLQQLKGQ